MSKKTLVIGATGNVGHDVVRLLVEAGQTVRAATRNPATYPHQHALVEPLFFDYDQPETYATAVAGINNLFVIAKSADPNPQQTLIPLLDAAHAAGATHVVLLTALGVDQNPELGLTQVEQHLIQSGMAYTILRPSWFMQNFTTGFIKPMLNQGGIYLPAGDGRTGLIDTRDIAAVAVAALHDSQHHNQAYNLTGSEAITYEEAADLLSQALGQPIAYVDIPEEAFRQALADAQWYPEQIDFMAGLLAIVRQGWAATVTPDVAHVLGRPPITLAQFVQDNLSIWQ